MTDINAFIENEVKNTINEAKNAFLKCYEKTTYNNGPYVTMQLCGIPYVEKLNEAQKKYDNISISNNYEISNVKSIFSLEVNNFLKQEDRLMKCVNANQNENVRLEQGKYCLRRFRNNFRLDKNNIVEMK